MKKTFGRVSRNEHEDIRVSLTEIQGELSVELRIFSRSARHGGGSQPEPECIVVPAHALSELCQVLEQARQHLCEEALVNVPTLGHLIVSEEGDSLSLQLAGAPASEPDVRREPPLSIRLPVDCYALDGPDVWPAGQITGEIGDLTSDSALIRLREQCRVGSRLAILMNHGELNFRGHAEVVGVEPHQQEGTYRHTLRWVSLSPQAKAALSKIIQTAANSRS